MNQPISLRCISAQLLSCDQPTSNQYLTHWNTNGVTHDHGSKFFYPVNNSRIWRALDCSMEQNQRTSVYMMSSQVITEESSTFLSSHKYWFSVKTRTFLPCFLTYGQKNAFKNACFWTCKVFVTTQCYRPPTAFDTSICAFLDISYWVKKLKQYSAFRQ